MAEKIEGKNPFEVLSAVNVNNYTEKRKGDNGPELTYLSWCFAVSEVKKRYPDMTYEVIKFNGLPYVYDDNTGYMVYTTVTINGVTNEMWLPVMNGANRAMKNHPYKYATKYGEKTVEAATMMDINKAIMRCLTKNLAMFGLGLYIYAGEDLPIVDKEEKEEEKPIVSEQEMAKPIDAAAWKGLQRELNDAGLSAAKVVGYYGLEKPSQITWDLLGQIRSEIKYLKKIEELKAEVA